MYWYVYIIECNDKTLYTGVTKDIERRVKEHNGGYGCKYTLQRYPVKLLRREIFNNKHSAYRREASIKKLTRKKKLELICGHSTTAVQ